MRAKASEAHTAQGRQVLSFREIPKHSETNGAVSGTLSCIGSCWSLGKKHSVFVYLKPLYNQEQDMYRVSTWSSRERALPLAGTTGSPPADSPIRRRCHHCPVRHHTNCPASRAACSHGSRQAALEAAAACPGAPSLYCRGGRENGAARRNHPRRRQARSCCKKACQRVAACN